MTPAHKLAATIREYLTSIGAVKLAEDNHVYACELPTKFGPLRIRIDPAMTAPSGAKLFCISQRFSEQPPAHFAIPRAIPKSGKWSFYFGTSNISHSDFVLYKRHMEELFEPLP